MCGLYAPKTPVNVGTVIRTVENFGGMGLQVFDSNNIFTKMGKRSTLIGDPTSCFKNCPITLVGEEGSVFKIPLGWKMIAVELVKDRESENLLEFSHLNGKYGLFYVFGPENGSLPKTVLDQSHYILKIPTRNCINLAVSVGIVLYDRLLKLKKD